MLAFNKAKFVLIGFLSCASSAVLAQEFAVEGKLTDAVGIPGTVTENGVTKDVIVPTNLVCNGSKVKVDATTEFSTPSGVIPSYKVMSTVRMPGMQSNDKAPAGKSAFLNGTCIIEGNTTGKGADIVNAASSVFVEIAENVLVGATTNPTGVLPFEIMGVKIVMLDPGVDSEGRVVAGKPKNGFGQEIDLKSVEQGDLSSAEGYFGDDGLFYSHVVETSGGSPDQPPQNPAATIQRGDATYVSNNRIKLEVRGGCVFVGAPTGTLPRTMQLTLAVDRGTTSVVNPDKTVTTMPIWVNPNDGRAIGPSTTNVACTEDPASPGNGTYRYRQDNYTGFGSNLPTKLKASVTPVAPATEFNNGPEALLNRTKFP
jgi:hypothetical protein